MNLFFVRLGESLERWIKKYLPDPLNIALFLTVFMAILAILLTPNSPLDVANAWGNGFWGFLSFSMQVALSMIAGAVVCNAPIVKRGMAKLCSIPKTSRQAAIFLLFCTYVLTWLNWGLGFISAGFLTRATARNLRSKNIPYHLPIIAAAAQTGTISYGGSWNSAVLIQLNTPGHFAEAQMGVIGLADAIFSKANLILLVGMFLVSAVVFWLLHPVDPSKFDQGNVADLEEISEAEKISRSALKASTFADRFNNIWIWNVGLLALWVAWFANLMSTSGPNAISLDVANISLIVFGLLAWKRPLAYMQSFRENTASASGVILQFHIYAGIMGIMRTTGLVEVISDAFASISNNFTYPLMTFISSSIINLAIPSGGGQWAAQGPVLIGAAEILGSDYFQTALSFAYSSSIMDLIIPFWILPIAGILKIKPRDIMGYTVAVTIFITIFCIIALTLLGMGVLPTW